MRTVKVAEHRGYPILETDIEVSGGRALIVPGLKEGPEHPTLTTVEQCVRFIDYQLEWRSRRISERETFEAEIVSRGGSLTVTVTGAATRMGLGTHDRVKVTLEHPDRRELISMYDVH